MHKLTEDQWAGLQEVEGFRMFRSLMRQIPKLYERQWASLLTQAPQDLESERVGIKAKIDLLEDIASWQWEDVEAIQDYLEGNDAEAG